MFRWAAVPFIRISLFLIVGILISRLVYFSFHWAWMAVLVSTFFLIPLLFKNLNQVWKGISFLLAIVCIGAFIQTERKIEPDDKLVDATQVFGIIDSYPMTLEDKSIYQLRIYSFHSDSSFVETHQYCRLTIAEENDIHLKYGDRILIDQSPSRIPPPHNPNAFDYAKYMANKNTYYQLWIRPANYKLINGGHGNPVLSKVYKLRSRFEQSIKRNVSSPEERAIALALLLGIKDELSPEVKQTFSKTGTMHVLAVSGLHVGIIYLLISMIFKNSNIGFLRIWLIPILSVFTIWIYALMTGFSASILRASIMFTLLIIAKAANIKTSTVNPIGLSAFILLMINPNNLFDVGFQLSFLAILGILVLYEPIHRLITPKYWITKTVWKVVCVSLAAQISTTPLSIYYFHQFPTLFLVSNLYVSVLINLLMGLGVLNTLLETFFNLTFLNSSFEWLLTLLYQGIKFINYIPYSNIEWLHISASQTIVSYLLISSLAVFLLTKQFKWLLIATSLCCVFSAESIILINQQKHKQQIVLYSDYKHKIIDQIHGFDAKLYSYDSLNSTRFIKSQVNPNRLSLDLPKAQINTYLNAKNYLLPNNNYGFIISGKRFIVMNSNHSVPTESPIKTCYLIISNIRKVRLEELEKKYSFQRLIIDSLQDNSYETIEISKRERI
ncbi:ComEC/Rec2 family competence protein [Reichenbachiella versicolor]|uniref:ComEC/Rec2 family competence protein n=1 Tax=Reichenbachiella versicolor TaxID=1821036 RepID=UPI000D6E0804|nr:ComEC/Rec2 family competence protein [Reichenbachiella versicolor]